MTSCASQTRAGSGAPRVRESTLRLIQTLPVWLPSGSAPRLPETNSLAISGLVQTFLFLVGPAFDQFNPNVVRPFNERVPELATRSGPNRIGNLYAFLL